MLYQLSYTPIPTNLAEEFVRSKDILPSMGRWSA